ncbi:SurA N-terminal domain-containing protein [Actinokineospora inagensis]|uniref:SurA N-terminal domain-containing protein n=1 Tax=Actinokineospora inagensis TaxID=103730 RepID=UPI0004027829|nr:SurA N-terminal domain-containing protein [Actinokineospora inagensis]
MTTVISRRAPLAASLLAFGLVLGACSSGPSQVNAAAIVGDKTISVDQVQDLVAKAVQAEPAARQLADQRKLDLVSRGVLRQLVLHELVQRYSTEHHLSVEPAKVSAFADQIKGSFQTLPTDGSTDPSTVVQQAVNRVLDPEQIAGDYLLMAQIGQDEAQKLSVTFDFTLIAAAGEGQPTGSLRQQAVDKARGLADAGLDGAAKVIDADIAAGAQASKNETLTPALAPDIAGTVIFGAPVNSVIAFQPNPENANWVVAVIRKRDTDAKPAANAEAPDPRVATTLAPQLLEATADQLGVKISPRYGVWDRASVSIAPSEAETTGVVFPVKNATP